MTTAFGNALRSFRHSSNDPHRLGRRLSQERLGRLIGEEMEDGGFTGAAVAYWESGESKISAEDRKVLLALIKVLHKCGGLKTLEDAKRFLESGNYRILDENEAEKIFGVIVPESPAQPTSAEPTERSGSTAQIPVGNFLFEFPQEFRAMLEKAKAEGPDPWWPRVL
ncbi:MAG: hypothetical protein L0287_14770, partial [Anaerolineae bacterium]|nr:hypothetical protein [Anaerolineae bacterium]